MKTAVLTFLAALVATSLRAESPVVSSVDLERLHISDLRSPVSATARINGVPQDRVVGAHLLPYGDKAGILIGPAENRAQYEEAVSTWRGILSRAGISLEATSYDAASGMYTFHYRTSDGTVLHRFMADPRQFKPKDEPSLRANEALVLDALAKRNVPVVASFVVDLPEYIPTYAVYYRAPADEDLGREPQLRILKTGEDIDIDLLEGAGISIIQQAQPWLIVYYGRQVSAVHGLARTPQDADEWLTRRMKYFAEQHIQVIGSRIHEFEPDPASEYRYLINVYLYP